MGLFERSEQGIGRGEVAESRIEVPFFTFFALLSVILLIVFHLTYQNANYTIAMSISLIVFAVTIIRVEFGLYVLMVAMLLSPEIEAGTVGTNEERGVNLRYDDILIGIIFLGVLVRQAFRGDFEFWRKNPINAGIVAYMSICVISSMRALHNNFPAWDESVALFVMLKMVEYYLVFTMVSLVITSAKAIQRQLIVFFAVSMVVCVYGLMSVNSMDRISAPFDVGGTEPNTLGGYLMIVMCVSGGLFITSPTLKWKLTFAGLALMAFMPLIMTLSRATYMSLFIAMLALGLFARKPMVIIAALLIVFTAQFTMPQEVIDRVMYTFQPHGVEVDIVGVEKNLSIDSSTYERVYVWEKVRFNLSVFPWIGGGISWDTVLDSQYARVLIETGLLGFAAFCFLLYRVLKTTWESYRWNRYWVTKGLSLGMLIATIGLMVHSLGTISFLIVRIMEPFWMLMAFVVVAREIALVDYRQRLAAYQEVQAQGPDEETPSRPLPAGSDLPAPT